MRLTAFLLLIVMLHAGQGISQRVSISGNNLSLEQVFATISKQTGFRFFYPSSLLKTAKPVTLDVKDMLVADVMQRCLEGLRMDFNIRGNTIVIFETEEAATASKDTALFIRGRVVDMQGLPVVMASVVLARTRAGTQTDRSGNFALKIKKLIPGDSIQISFIGCKTQPIKLDQQTDLGLIVLQAADNALDQAVITAYGTTTEKFRTGDITTVKAVDIERTPTLNVLESLSGRVPGLYMRQKGSNPGSIYDIQLRGYNVMPPTTGMVFGGDAHGVLSKPLIVLDGLPLPPDIVNETGVSAGVDAITGMSGAAGGQDALYWLNPLNVESITVLKDAEATSLYGSRAANGVIMITTKKGKTGKTSLSLSLNTGINALARRLKLMNTEEYLAMRHEAWNNTMRAGLYVFSGNGIGFKPDAANSYDLLTWDTTRYTDWQQELLGSAPVHNANISLSGGEGRTSWRLSAGHNRFKSSYPHLPGKPAFRDEKTTFSLNVSSRSLNNRFTWTASVVGAATVSYQPVYNPDPFIFLAPNAPPVFDPAGNLNFVDWRRPSLFPVATTNNPLWILACNYQSNRFNIFSRMTMSYEILRSLTFTIGAGYARSDGKQLMILPAAASDPILTSIFRQSMFGYPNSTGLNIEPNLRYTIRTGRHAVSILAGVSYQSDKQEGRTIIASGYTSDELMGTPDAATSLYSNTSVLQRKSVAALGRIAYRYADEFLIDLSARRDGSSSFGPGRRYGNFGSVGWGWIFTREAWSKAIPLLGFGKIRGSYGITGNQSANPYAYLSTFRSSSGIAGTAGVYQGIPTLSITRIANPHFGWAQAATLELGMDLYLLKEQQLKMTLQWYRKITGNQLVTTPVSYITGTNEYFANLPVKLENRGWEAMIDYTPSQKQAVWQWYVHANIAANKNKLRAFPGLENSLFKGYYTVGLPLVWQYLNPAELDTATGAWKIRSGADRYQAGNYPILTGGLQTGIAYKRVSLSLSFTFAKQKGFTNVQGASYPGRLNGQSNSNQPRSVMQERHWQSPADSAIGGAFHAADVSNISYLDIYWGDASYMAIKNATLNYELPPTWLKKAGMSGVNIYARAENLLLLPLSDYKGMNPEQPGLDRQMPLRLVFVSGFTINL